MGLSELHSSMLIQMILDHLTTKKIDFSTNDATSVGKRMSGWTTLVDDFNAKTNLNYSLNEIILLWDAWKSDGSFMEGYKAAVAAGLFTLESLRNEDNKGAGDKLLDAGCSRAGNEENIDTIKPGASKSKIKKGLARRSDSSVAEAITAIQSSHHLEGITNSMQPRPIEMDSTVQRQNGFYIADTSQRPTLVEILKESTPAFKRPPTPYFRPVLKDRSNSQVTSMRTPPFTTPPQTIHHSIIENDILKCKLKKQKLEIQLLKIKLELTQLKLQNEKADENGKERK